MRKMIVSVMMVGMFAASFYACGPAEVCKVGETKDCTCLDLKGTQSCKDDGSGFSSCRCGNSGGEKSTSEVLTETTTPDEPTTTPDEPTTTPDEPTTTPDEPTTTPDEPLSADEPAGDAGEPVTEVLPEVSCASDEFSYKGKCYTNADFCEGNIAEPGFPAFTAEAQKGMKQPYELEFDSISNKPIFCKTKENYYYLPGAGYGECDIDKDGWINIEAYRAVTSTIVQVQTNARCKLKKFQHIAYHAEGKKTQIQKLKNIAAMVETFRNDGGEKKIELPVYSKNQAPLPKAAGTTCTDDAGCTNQVCYRGHCVAGRRFEPAEINTLTKGCIAGLDLNDNQLDDANEGPSDTPTPAGEFGPLLNSGYFMELHYGNYQGDYDNAGTKIPVYHIYERSRSKTTKLQGLPLNCQQKKDGFTPDFWKRCTLKDNQQCADPADPNKLKKGLTSCWFKDVNRLIPSLFKCAVFENASNHYFHPSNYGFDKNYNRSICSFKAKLNPTDNTKRDIQFECTVDPGTRKPDPSQKEVGWACVSFKSYKTPADYMGSCVDQMAEKVCGDKKDKEVVTYIKLEKDSYGLARAWAPCGTSSGKGACSKAKRTCTGGTWLACNKCNHCPQNTIGQKAACSKGTWPTDSCKLKASPTTEKCDGIDNDCDGSIDEGLVTKKYYFDKDLDGYGSGTPVIKCVGQQPTQHVLKSGDCDDNNKAIKPGVSDPCDGIDNNCNSLIDENSTKVNFYKDDDKDGYRGAYVFKACYKINTNKAYLCKGKNDCVTIAYGSGLKYLPLSSKSADCCDSDANAKPGQTTYFSAKNKCSSWDYNCNNKADIDSSLRICQCSKTAKYREYATATCSGNSCSGDFATAKTKCKNSDCSITSKDGTFKCLLDGVHTFEATQNYSKNCKRKCRIVGTGKMTHSCNKSNLSGTNASVFDTTSLGYITFLKSQFSSSSSSTCHFLDNGNKPSCGEMTRKMVKNASQTAPFSDTHSKNFCSQSKDQCTVKNWVKASCTYSHYVQYNANSYYYFKNSSTQTGVIVKCR